jgi:hypothetical protein
MGNGTTTQRLFDPMQGIPRQLCAEDMTTTTDILLLDSLLVVLFYSPLPLYLYPFSFSLCVVAVTVME